MPVGAKRNLERKNLGKYREGKRSEEDKGKEREGSTKETSRKKKMVERRAWVPNKGLRERMGNLTEKKFKDQYEHRGSKVTADAKKLKRKRGSTTETCMESRITKGVNRLKADKIKPNA